MKRTVVCLCVLLAVLYSVQCARVNKTRLSCNTVLENKNVSFEYNYFPGNQLVPGYKSKYGYGVELPSIGSNELTYTNEAAWGTEQCGDSLCIVSLKQDWENYYLTSHTGYEIGVVPKLIYYKDIKDADPALTVQYDIECEDCSKMKHCYIIQSYSEEKGYSLMFVWDLGGMDSFIVFVSSHIYDTYDTYDLFEWAIHVHDHVPAGADGLVSFNWVILATAALWLSGC
eukprot:GFUD01021815.1.p1 GENE.GFUD01021815.1~~GFUD01021815.1.p1  ORF type:complete len:228 (-),score=30.38 GFUD01021815.1:128-811(-)